MNYKKFFKLLNFNPKNGTVNSYCKSYNSYEITVDFNENNPAKSKINYGSKIKVGRATTCNFSQNESLVVLECVNRLLDKGYKPENIELEKVWNLGHKGKGFLDILVKDEKKKSFLMIECKNWGADYENEKKNTLSKSKNGSQIFSYLQQEPKTTKAICLYASNLETGDYINAIIYNKPEWADLNQEERFKRWVGEFEDNGVFENWVKPYALKSKAILRKDLKALTKEDGDNIYNKFAEILRHNVISDKSNAFNKIINLFLCKVYDENRNQNEEVKFQIRTGTTEKDDETLLSDLSDLYTKGMKEFLKKDIEDYTTDELERKLKTADKEELRHVYKVLRLYKDNVFAFREVFDKISFKDNAKVVHEIVELLQDKQLKYGHKQQFLGDFFESLLKDSIKQESGQFFTPTPLTQFIIKSMPLKEKIVENIEEDKDEILPFTIDYAMGSGHFLTEIMDEYNKIVKNLPEENLKPSVKKQVRSWKADEFSWAEKYVYGVDLDYRLVKTSKIACFLNGDGLAQVIHADGLDSFSKSTTYKNLLKSNSSGKDLAKFDVLISNPPYAVKAFRNTLNDGENSFELYNNLTDDSKEIECLFVERAKQLLKEEGMVGIVLPVSVLTNGGIYEKTREIILKNFKIKGIVSLGSNAFMATGTKTIILFMKKCNSFIYNDIESLVDTFLRDYTDVVVNGIQKAFSKYAESIYDDLVFKDYLSILKNNPTDKAKESECYKEYKNLSNEDILKIEKQKLIYFMMTYSQQIVLADSKDKNIEKEFYGYEFSNRRGHEGIHPYRDENGHIQSKLYNPAKTDDKTKLNHYLLKSFKNEAIEKDIEKIKQSVEHPLKEHIDYLHLSDLMTFDLKSFDKSINLNRKKKNKIESKYPLEKVSLLCKLGRGRVLSRKYIKKHSGKYPLYSSQTSNKGVLGHINTYDFEGEYATWTTDGANAGTVFLRNGKFNCTNVCGTLKSKVKNVNMKYLTEILNTITKNYVNYVGNPKLMNEDMGNIKIPLPPLDIQNKIVKEIEKIEQKEQKANETIKSNQEKTKKDFENSFHGEVESLRLGDSDVFEVSIGKRVLSKEITKNKKRIPVYSANVFEPFGYIGKNLIKDFDTHSVLWGIDGDWMVNLIEKNKPFYPTDHCGVLKIKNNNKINYHFLRLALHKAGKKVKFSRNYRASIDRIKQIKITFPSIEVQNELSQKAKVLKKEIENAKTYLENSKTEKQDILDKHLK